MFPGRRDSQGFSLVEVVLALGIAAFALITLIGMLPMGIASHRDADRETMAVSLLNTIVTDLKDSATNEPTLLFGLSPHPLTSSGVTTLYFAENEKNVAGASNALCKVEIRPGAASQNLLRCNVRVTWPAQAPVGKEDGLVETYLQLKP